MIVLGWEESPACVRPTRAGVPRRQKLRKQVSHEVGGSSCLVRLKTSFDLYIKVRAEVLRVFLAKE